MKRQTNFLYCRSLLWLAVLIFFANLTVRGNATIGGSLTTLGAQQTCVNMNARVGTTTDVSQTFGTSGFNYFGSAGQGWLGDYAGDNKRAVWNVPFVTPDFDGDALHFYTDGANNTAPVPPFRCVY